MVTVETTATMVQLEEQGHRSPPPDLSPDRDRVEEGPAMGRVVVDRVEEVMEETGLDLDRLGDTVDKLSRRR